MAGQSGVERKFLFGVVLLMLASCVSSPPKGEVQLSSKAEALFVRCLPGDGSLELNISSSQNKTYLSSYAEWLGENASHYTLQLSDPLGRTAVQIKAGDERLQVKGSAAGKLPKLGMDDEGYLTVSSQRLGIKVVELPCFLKLSLPLAWQEQVVERSVEGDFEKLRISLDQRKIVLTIPRAEKAGSAPVCGELRWWQYWGMVSNELSWCFDYVQSTGEMRLPKGWKISWKLEENY